MVHVGSSRPAWVFSETISQKKMTTIKSFWLLAVVVYSSGPSPQAVSLRLAWSTYK